MFGVRHGGVTPRGFISHGVRGRSGTPQAPRPCPRRRGASRVGHGLPRWWRGVQRSTRSREARHAITHRYHFLTIGSLLVYSWVSRMREGFGGVPDSTWIAIGHALQVERHLLIGNLFICQRRSRLPSDGRVSGLEAGARGAVLNAALLDRNRNLPSVALNLPVGLYVEIGRRLACERAKVVADTLNAY